MIIKNAKDSGSTPNESLRNTAKPGLHPKKGLLCFWWSTRGMVRFEMLKE